MGADIVAGFTAEDVADQSGKTFIVTGGNTGLGYETSLVLAAKGARVLLACRDEGRALGAIARIRHAVPDADLTFLPLDQGDLDSVRAAAEIARQEARLDGLINNAGIMYPPLMRTRQGFESQFGVNHLGGFALTSLLLPKLAETPGSRVVVTSSLAHRGGKIDWHDLNAERSYDPGKRYGASKLANMLFMLELDRRLRAVRSPITAVGCHPGFARTDLMRHSLFLRAAIIVLHPFSNTSAQGAWPTLQAAAGPVEPGGYYGPRGPFETKGKSRSAYIAPQARDLEQARRLWDISVEMTGIDPGLAAAA